MRVGPNESKLSNVPQRKGLGEIDWEKTPQVSKLDTNTAVIKLPPLHYYSESLTTLIYRDK